MRAIGWTKSSLLSVARQRTRYSPYIKEQVRKRYHLCRTTEDKQALADELGIGSVSKLYNLASRLDAAGQRDQNIPGEGSEPARESDLREDPKTIKWSRKDEKFLRSEFGRLAIENIAYHLGHSETAVLYKARHMGLRLPAKHWRLDKVSRWLGLSEDRVRELAGEGVDIHQLANRAGEVVLEVVSLSSLGRWMKQTGNTKRLREEGDPDPFFILEIRESMKDLADKETRFESCKFLSHGHICQNPFTENSYGLFCTNNEKYRAGEDPYCAVRTLAIEDIAPKKDEN